MWAAISASLVHGSVMLMKAERNWWRKPKDEAKVQDEHPAASWLRIIKEFERLRARKTGVDTVRLNIRVKKSKQLP
eukprot:3928051-Amphidinium_carterae.2